MKKLIMFILLGISLLAKSQQDSVLVTVGVQARDLKYMGKHIIRNYEIENVYDSIKVKFRGPIQNVPTGTDVVSVRAYAKDWIILYQSVWTDALAIKANTQSRLRTLLLAAGSTYITNQITILDNLDTSQFQATQDNGLKLYRRQ